jgi:predicted RNA-binding protein associated with RNAse of E/G family
MHPPKVETFDVHACTNTDPKGFVRPVDEYRTEEFGLYLDRAMPDHPRFARLESWLLPALGIRVTDWWFRPGQERDQDFYLDIVDIDRSGPDGSVWRTVDHYLDVVVRTGRSSTVVDLDEFVTAVASGLLSRAEAERALANSYRALTGLGAHGHDVNAWLTSLGIQLTWRRHPATREPRPS